MAHNYSDEMVVINKIDQAWVSAAAAWQQYKTAREKPSISGLLYSTMDSMGGKVNEAHDFFADALGKLFVRGDHLFESDMEDLQNGLLSQLSTSLKALCSTSHSRAEPSHDLEAETLQLAVKSVARTIHILEQLASRLGYNVQSSEASTSSMNALCDDSAEIDWCKGALLIQQSLASYQSTMAQPVSQLGKVCKFCYLEVSDYRSKALRHADEDWSALASCHVLASSSFKDRRAAYRCFGCYVSGVSKIHTSAASIFDHIATCEGFVEKRTRPQLPPRKTMAEDGRQFAGRVQSYSDSSASSVPATPSTNGTHTPSKPRAQAPPPSSPISLPLRNPLPVPPTEAGLTSPRHPETLSFSQNIPGTFPTAKPVEQPVQSPSASRTFKNIFRPSTSSITRKSVLAPQLAQSSPPPQNPSRVPPPALPTQVSQLMELGATRREAENSLNETNWDVPQAAEFFWQNRQVG